MLRPSEFNCQYSSDLLDFHHDNPFRHIIVQKDCFDLVDPQNKDAIFLIMALDKVD